MCSKLQAVEVELSRAHKSLDSLLSQREEKDAQVLNDDCPGYLDILQLLGLFVLY